MEYSIDICFGCKKCLYCENVLSIQKKTCLYNKTIKPNKKTELKERKSTPNLKKIDSNENNLVNNELINECETIDLEETVQIISFNLVVKPSNSAALPSKWMEIEVLSLDDIFVDVHCYVKKLTEDDKIMHSDYLITLKPEKNAGSGTQLVDMHNYKNFFQITKNYQMGKKNITIMMSLKKKDKKDKQSKRKRGLALDSEGSGSENVDVHRSDDGTGKFANFKKTFEDEYISVNQIYDHTDAEFDQLGVKKIGWCKAIRAAVQYYNR
ncbi:hypothetical protein GLOIN_2v1870151 [Rhizophagus clarus]|uniref:Uncharacterized protein n=1 Tax=Rhizophagus clarus TaxID=94130 RepID=A0A8H3QFY0_9GLOM|nr:hypothetical protein GLOIN_2v1870151 [Rhizophagus clarus]